MDIATTLFPHSSHHYRFSCFADAGGYNPSVFNTPLHLQILIEQPKSLKFLRSTSVGNPLRWSWNENDLGQVLTACEIAIRRSSLWQTFRPRNSQPRAAGLPDLTVSIRAIACLPPTTFPQVFDMRVRSSTPRLHLLEYLFMLTSRLAGSSHLSLLRWKNGLDSHSPGGAYHLWYVPTSLCTDISSIRKRVYPPIGWQKGIAGHQRGALRPLGPTIYPQEGS